MKKDEALSQIDEGSVISFAQELVRIPSENPPGAEEQVAHRVEAFFSSLDIPVEIIESAPGRVNVLAGIRGDAPGPRLLFNGHMDVVPAGPGWDRPSCSGDIVDGKLHGRGSCDMKGGLAAILAVARLFRELDLEPKGELQFAIVADEEAGGRYGTGYLVEHGHIRADMAIVAEPSDFKLSISEGGVLWVTLETRGTRTHTINAREAVNAVQKMANVIVRLEKEAEALSAIEHEKHGTPVLTVNVVRGGLKTNLIPDQCTAEVDFRFPPGIDMTIEQARDRVEAVLSDLRERDPGLDVSGEFNEVAYPFEQDEDIAIAHSLRSAARRVLGREPAWWREGKKRTIPTDDSDVFHLWVKAGIPSVYFGPGRLEQCHTANEWIYTKDIVDAARIYSLLALDLLTDLT